MNKKLKLAFCLFKYFPFGGLQGDFMGIAKECMDRGHKVVAYTISWEGKKPEGLEVRLLPVSGMTNHARYKSFAQLVHEYVKGESYDVLVGFNKMTGLDVYYAADVSYAAKMMERSRLHRYTPRYRTLMALERAVFDKGSKTEILLLTEKEKNFYMDYYGTTAERFHLMPPGISRAFLPPVNADKIGDEKREELLIGREKTVLLMVCTNFKIKGVARAIRAVSALPPEILRESVLLVVGKDNPRHYSHLAKQLKVLEQVRFIGTRSDVPQLLMAADFFIHPASVENTGTVIIEALAANVPVLTTDICGYSFHVTCAQGGQVVRDPFNQEELNQALSFMLTSDQRNVWQANCKKYIEHTDIFSRSQKVADFIEKVTL
ncbi:glycosyltransferase family 4 protein [Desulfobacula phenolica]|nr:glycosyltransferase family 4 protein [Desulfobacula phenolica]